MTKNVGTSFLISSFVKRFFLSLQKNCFLGLKKYKKHGNYSKIKVKINWTHFDTRAKSNEKVFRCQITLPSSFIASEKKSWYKFITMGGDRDHRKVVWKGLFDLTRKCFLPSFVSRNNREVFSLRVKSKNCGRAAPYLQARVTRLGQFSPIGRLPSLGSFWKLQM
jgi:hypothetical protein